MAELTPEVMFLEGNPDGYSSKEIAQLNYEIMDALGELVPGTTGYLSCARAFREEVRRPPRSDRITTLG